MSMKKFVKPTESELEILQLLWEFGPSTVRFINDKLNETREVGYTTTLKLMQIMHDKKGLADRNTDARTHIYSAAVTEGATRNSLLNQFLDKTFKGSATQLVMQALGNHKASQDELDEIKALIARIEEDQDK